MDARSNRRKAKNTLNRLPAPLRDRLGRFLLRRYEWYEAARTSDQVTAGAGELPVPPPKLRVRVVGHTDLKMFLEAGRKEREIVGRALEASRIDREPVRILDWGCGCGRILRWWDGLPGLEVNGCDYDPQLVGWVNENLPFAEARVNQLEPPLPYESGSFDFVYAISVFTHLTEALAIDWMEEILRVLAPGGCFMFTTHGGSYRDRLDPAELARFDRGEAVVQFPSTQGSNLCASYFPRQWVQSRLLDGAELVELLQPHEMDEADRDTLAQDRWLIRKPG